MKGDPGYPDDIRMYDNDPRSPFYKEANSDEFQAELILDAATELCNGNIVNGWSLSDVQDMQDWDSTEKHVVRPGDTLADVIDNMYGSPKHAEGLAEWRELTIKAAAMATSLDDYENLAISMNK